MLTLLLVLFSVAAPASSSCPLDAAALTQTLVPKSESFQFECHELEAKRSPKSYVAYVSLNNPEKGAESYLAIVNGDAKKLELVKSQLVGMEAFPMRLKKALKFSIVLSDLDAEELKIATNALYTSQNTALAIWAVNPRSGIIRELEKTILPANHVPDAKRVKNAWEFSAKGKKLHSYVP